MNINLAMSLFALGAAIVLLLVVVASCDGSWRNR